MSEQVDVGIKPYFDRDGVTLYHGDCLDILPRLGVCADVSFCDPPWGVKKATWDETFDIRIVEACASATRSVMAVTPGISNLLSLPRAISGMLYRWSLSIRIMNSRMRGALGFGNWIACPLYARGDASVYTCAQDCTDIVIRGHMPNHADPKPIDAMRWILARLPTGTVLDPTAGSGTTLLAAREAGRKAIGIEIDEQHCETAAVRLGATPRRPADDGPLFGGLAR